MAEQSWIFENTFYFLSLIKHQLQGLSLVPLCITIKYLYAYEGEESVGDSLFWTFPRTPDWFFGHFEKKKGDYTDKTSDVFGCRYLPIWGYHMTLSK